MIAALNFRAVDEHNLGLRHLYGDTYNSTEYECFERKHRQHIEKAWAAGDINGVLAWLDNTIELPFVFDNQDLFLERGLFEVALVNAYQATRLNYRCWDQLDISHLFSRADLGKLRAAGDPMPQRERYTLFRGVAGNGRARKVNGVSWTDSMETATFFAKRFNLNNPAVFTVTVGEDLIFTYLSGRDESEYVLRLPLPQKPQKL